MSSFSIVVPVYKTEQYLDHCVESVLAQTWRDFELILVDDGSPDRCGAICDGWAKKDSRIRVIHQDNGGLSAARNAGIAGACGEYIMFLDSDDWWAGDQVLAQIASHLERTDADVVSFNYRKEYNGDLQPLYFAQSIPSSRMSLSVQEMMDTGCWVTGACNKAVRRSLLTGQQLYFRTGITAEDIDWTLRLALAAQRFAFANVCVFIYRQHGESISNSPTVEKIQCLCGNVRECVALLERAQPEKAAALRPFVAYQYGTLLHNVANLHREQRKAGLMMAVNEMSSLLDWGGGPKIRLLRRCRDLVGMEMTLKMLRLRQTLLTWRGKGV